MPSDSGSLPLVVFDDVQESYTVNLCEQCDDERLTAQGLALLKTSQWKADVEKKAHVADCGECWERTSLYQERGSISLLQERAQ